MAGRGRRTRANVHSIMTKLRRTPELWDPSVLPIPIIFLFLSSVIYEFLFYFPSKQPLRTHTTAESIAKSGNTQPMEEGIRAQKGQLLEVEEPEDYEWMWGSTDRFVQKLPPSFSKATSPSQSADSSSHSGGSGCSIRLCDHGRHLYAINKHKQAELDASNLRANKAESGEKVLAEENIALATRVSEVTTQYCTLGVDYAAARDLIKQQRVEIAFTRSVAGISIVIAIMCLVIVMNLYSVV